ncbi:hypothetical protein B0H13DRAFT_1912035 [Mycena leptocephala]|nr:hypothetical protein B0H13DRAFT_1912035 [Mycena leptocephala]
MKTSQARVSCLECEDEILLVRSKKAWKGSMRPGKIWVGCGEGEGTSYKDVYNAAADAASTAPLFHTRQCRLAHAQPQEHRKFITKRRRAALRSAASGRSNPKLNGEERIDTKRR